jgi:protein O-GlcNAc transferase
MKHRPNEPCPCGSGRKYKKCHGSPASVVNTPSLASPVTVDWLARGRQMEAMSCPEQAEQCYQKALRQAPKSAGAWFSLGGLAERAGDLEAARDCYLRLVELHPENASGYFALGNIFARLYAFELARNAYFRATELEPGLTGAWANLGNIEKYLGRFHEAINCYRQAIERDTDPGQQAKRHSYLLFSLHYDESFSHGALYQAHLEWAMRYASPLYPLRPVWPNTPVVGRTLRLGYVSGSFDGQIMGHFLQNVFAHHDRSQFQIFLFSSTRIKDAHTEKFQQLCQSWIDIEAVDDESAAESIRKSEIDILVDLDGHTQKGRPLIFARKPSPVQVAWSDYFNTSGMETVDYILTDSYTTPESSPQLFSEVPVRLPQTRLCYTPVEYAPPIALMPSLSGTPFTFGSFNRQDKLHPALLRIWADILHAAPGSRLLLKNRALQVPTVRQSLENSFAGLGISSSRLLLRGPSPHAEMLSEYGDVDVALDTFPYNGGLTSCECLWMGVPIVALEEERMIGRQTAAMLRLLGLDDWVVKSSEDYIRLAVEMSRRRAEVASLRASLRQRMAQSPLCDAPQFARDLESAYRAMWKHYCDKSERDTQVPR